MLLPLLAPYPPVDLQKQILPEEWENCLDSWLLLTQRYLLLPSAAFAAQVITDSSLIRFLTSYVNAVSLTDHGSLAKTGELRKYFFLLVHRALKEVNNLSPMLLEWQFLSRLSLVFSKTQTLKELLPNTWHKYKLGESASMRKNKILLISMMEEAHVGLISDDKLDQFMAFARSCCPYAQFLMVGSDLLDSVVCAYDRVTLPSLRKRLVALAYVCFESLLSHQEDQTSVLLDHLYGLKSTKLARALIEGTPFLDRLQKQFSQDDKASGRAKPLLDFFAKFGNRSKPKNYIRRRVENGKHRIMREHRQDASGEMHVHKLSLITQVQDLFPELGSEFIIKLLDEYHDDTEVIIAHLLDNSLPPHLKQADHSETFDLSNSADIEQSQGLANDLVPHSTPPLPPSRRNIYDDDDFDKLAVDASKIRFGPKNPDLTADQLLSSERSSNQKAKILSALATFDADDDERDDTYDAEDVGGTVDSTFANDEAEFQGGKNDEVLFNAYRTSRELFKRDWNTRRGQPRQSLKRDTGMTDEAIEGWAIMLSRDPKQLMRLERAHETGHGLQQSALGSTAWRADSAAEDIEGSDGAGPQTESRGHGRSVGPGRRKGKEADTHTGPASENSTQVARQRKDANKGSRANHTRRDQRARKMARGGLAG